MFNGILKSLAFKQERSYQQQLERVDLETMYESNNNCVNTKILRAIRLLKSKKDSTKAND